MEVKPGYKQTEVGLIPQDWGTSRLQTMVQRNTPIAYGVLKPGEYVYDGVPLLQIRDVIHGDIDVDQLHRISSQLDAQYSRTSLVGGEIVVSLVGTIGKVALIPMTLAGGNIHRNLARLLLSQEHDPAFVFYFLSSELAQAAIKLTTFGSTQALLNLADLRDLWSVVPPLPEQRAIAAALCDVDALLGGLDRLIAKKRELKQAAMQQLLTGQTRLPGFSGEWEVKRFGSLVEHVFPKSPLSSGDGLEQGTYPLLVSGGEPKRIEVAQFRDLETLVFSDGGVFAVRCATGNYSVTDHCFVLALNPAAADMRWFEAWFSLHSQQMDRLTFKGSGLRNLDKPSLRNIDVCTPGRVEQTAIAAVLSDMDAELAALEARRDKTRDLKQAMMQELLTGKTRLVKPEAAHA